ncbi:MAG: hypothetical protein WC544_01585 [Patescibacteria group bacterium]
MKFITVLAGLLLLCGITSAASAGQSITVDWTAPGDDSTVGTCAGYDMRIFDGIVTVDTINWNTGIQLSGEPAPEKAGTVQSMTINVPDGICTFTLNLRAYDDGNNWSPPSNSPWRFQTIALPYPNPFNPGIGDACTFECLQSSTEVLIVADYGGLIRRLIAENDKVVWDGTDQYGNPVADGVYIYWIPDLRLKGKIVLTR